MLIQINEKLKLDRKILDGCGLSGPRTLKLAVSQEGINEIN